MAADPVAADSPVDAEWPVVTPTVAVENSGVARPGLPGRQR